MRTIKNMIETGSPPRRTHMHAEFCVKGFMKLKKSICLPRFNTVAGKKFFFQNNVFCPCHQSPHVCCDTMSSLIFAFQLQLYVR